MRETYPQMIDWSTAKEKVPNEVCSNYSEKNGLQIYFGPIVNVLWCRLLRIDISQFTALCRRDGGSFSPGTRPMSSVFTEQNTIAASFPAGILLSPSCAIKIQHVIFIHNTIFPILSFKCWHQWSGLYRGFPKWKPRGWTLPHRWSTDSLGKPPPWSSYRKWSKLSFHCWRR